MRFSTLSRQVEFRRQIFAKACKMVGFLLPVGPDRPREEWQAWLDTALAARAELRGESHSVLPRA